MPSILKNKKFRPWIIGAALLVGGIVLFMMMRSKGGEASGVAVAGGPSEQLQAMQLQVGAQSQAAALAANVELARITADAESYRYGQDVASEMAQYAAQTQQNISLASIAAQERITAAQETTAQRANEISGQIQLAGINAQTEIAGYQFDFMRAQESEITRRTEIQTRGMVSMNRTSTFGGVLGAGIAAIAGIFSDVRLKRDVTWTGSNFSRNPQGRGFIEYGRYSWTYRGQAATAHGVIAQDVRAIPGAIVNTRRDRYQAVDYGALPA